MTAFMKKFVKPPLTDLMKRIPTERLDKQLSQQELAMISTHLLKWPSKAVWFGLSESDIENIREDNRSDHERRKMVMMEKWARRYGDKATLRELIQISRHHEWGKKFINKVCGEFGYSKGQCGILFPVIMMYVCDVWWCVHVCVCVCVCARVYR